MAYGSKYYMYYYAVQGIFYCAVGVYGFFIYFGFKDQCFSVCPVAAVKDLQLAKGYDSRYQLDGFKIDRNQRGAYGEKEASAGRLPVIYTHYFACNLSDVFGSPHWWNSTHPAYQPPTEVWKAAVKVSTGKGGEPVPSGYFASHAPSFYGLNRSFWWEKDEWLTSDPRDDVTSLAHGAKSKCYVCCDPAYLATKQRCRPSISSVTVHTWCNSESQCESGFRAAPDFPTPTNMSAREMLNTFCFILALAYFGQGTMCVVVSIGFRAYADKYEQDFNEENLSVCDKFLGTISKQGPNLNRIVNSVVMFISIFGFFLTSWYRSCEDAHDQFGVKSYLYMVNIYFISVLVLFIFSCVAGTAFRQHFIPDPAFYKPDETASDEIYGVPALELVSNGRTTACICRYLRKCKKLYCACGP